MAELADELGPLLTGGAVKSVVSLPPRDLLLVVAVAGERAGEAHLRLRLSASPERPRLHLQAARQKRPKGPVGPFFRLCDEVLTGATLTGVACVGGDRIARVDFRTEAGERALVLELTGRHANLILTDGDGRVLRALVPPPKGREDPRLVEGEPYRAPPGKPPAGDRTPPLAEYLGGSQDPSPEGTGDAEPHPAAPLSWRVETVLGVEVEDAATDRLRRELAKRMEKKLARTRRNLAGLTERAAAADGAERVREDGELLKANLGSFGRGDRAVEVEDYFDPEAARRKIELDPKLTPHENVTRTFARYKKLVKARASVHQDIAYATERMGELEALLERLRAGGDPAELEAEAVQGGLLPRPQSAPDPKQKQQAPKPRLPYRTFAGLAGGQIRVGRSARDNDELTLRHSKGSDLWLHTADAPGSHVVLCVERGAEPDPEDVLDAAHLAVHFSPLKGARKADVHVAARKLVHKPKGAKAGLVTLSGGKVLAVRMQPDRLDRLLGSDRPPARNP